MARFLIIGRYAAEGARGLMAAGGSARKSAVEKAVTGLGGRIETFDFAFGEDDVFAITELPDHKTAAALALAINGAGTTHVRTVVLMTPEEVDDASHVSVTYVPPGR